MEGGAPANGVRHEVILDLLSDLSSNRVRTGLLANVYVCTCKIHTYIHTYLPTYLPTYLASYLASYLPSYLPSYLAT